MDADAKNTLTLMKARGAFAFHNGTMQKTVAPKMLDNIAQRVATEAKKGAPVRTGALRRSIRVKRVNQFRRIVEAGGAGTGVDYAQAVEFGTMHQRPQPYFEPAVRKVISKTPAITRPSIGKWLRSLAMMIGK